MRPCLLCADPNARAYTCAVTPVDVDRWKLGVVRRDGNGRAAVVEAIDRTERVAPETFALLNSSDTLEPPLERPRPELDEPELSWGSSWSAP